MMRYYRTPLCVLPQSISLMQRACFHFSTGPSVDMIPRAAGKWSCSCPAICSVVWLVCATSYACQAPAHVVCPGSRQLEHQKEQHLAQQQEHQLQCNNPAASRTLTTPGLFAVFVDLSATCSI